MKHLSASFVLFSFTVLLLSCNKTEIETPANNTELTRTAPVSKATAGTTTGRLGELPPPDPAPVCNPTVVTLFAGQTIDAGNISVINDQNFITVTYNAGNGYVLTKTHLYVGDCELIPVNGGGNPMPGQFPYTSSHDNVTSYTYQIPILSIPAGSCGCIAAHCNLVKYNAAGEIIDTQSGWGNGINISPKGNWGMKFNYCSCTM